MRDPDPDIDSATAAGVAAIIVAVLLVVFAIIGALATTASPHPGRLDAEGRHTAVGHNASL